MTGLVATNLSLSPRSQSPSVDASTSGLTLFCDFDGPIMDVSDRYYSTYQLGLADTQAYYQAQGVTLPIQPLPKAAFWQMKQDRIPDIEIAVRSGLDSEQIDVFLERVGQIVNQPTLLYQDQLQPGVRWALAWLRSQNVRLVLLTLRCQAQATQILQEEGLDHLFTSIRGTQDCKVAYYNQAHLKTQLLQELLNEPEWSDVKQGSAWIVGDTEADILAGQAMGIPAIALTCGIRSRRYLQKYKPTCILTDLLSAAQYLVGQPRCTAEVNSVPLAR